MNFETALTEGRWRIRQSNARFLPVNGVLTITAADGCFDCQLKWDDVDPDVAAECFKGATIDGDKLTARFSRETNQGKVTGVISATHHIENGSVFLYGMVLARLDDREESSAGTWVAEDEGGDDCPAPNGR